MRSRPGIFIRSAFLSIPFVLLFLTTTAQKSSWRIVSDTARREASIFQGKQLFTRFIYPDSLAKPVLYPVYSSSGQRITRGFPLQPVEGDPQDHPHHLGIWMNFENVNGLDFWNNSFAIPAANKHRYGWIWTKNVTSSGSGKQASLSYQATWANQAKETLLEEKTDFIFSGSGHTRIIDRTTTLTAVQDVLFKDAKDGLMAIRVRPELQLPDTSSNANNSRATGNYLTSEGKKGNDAWGTRAKWCMLFGKVGPDSISIAFIDHPKNPGYPAYWHARDYGLFSINPLGQHIFSKGSETLDLTLKSGESATFRYRIVVNDDKRHLSPAELDQLSEGFPEPAK